MIDSARHAETYKELCEHDPDLDSNAKQDFIPAWANSLAEEQNMSDPPSDEDIDADQLEELEAQHGAHDGAQPFLTDTSAATSHTDSDLHQQQSQAPIEGGADLGAEAAEAVAALTLADRKQELRRNERVSFNYYDNVARNVVTAPHPTDIPRSDYNALADAHLAAATQ